MTILVEPIMISAMTDARKPRPVAGHPRQRSVTVHTVVPSCRSESVNASTSVDELLRLRDRLPPEHPGRATLRARAIEQSLPMAGRLARRYAGRGELFDDLAQVAAVALINAVDRYDPNRQVPFVGFAIPSILGALKRHFRDATWAMRVPRSIQERALGIPAAADQVSQQQGRTPTTAELADYLQLTVGEVRAAIGARRSYRLASLNGPSQFAEADFIDAIDRRYRDIDDRLAIQQLIGELPLRERRILTMRFYDHMSQSQIAAEIGVSQMHVSRLLKQSLTRLRAAMPL